MSVARVLGWLAAACLVLGVVCDRAPGQSARLGGFAPAREDAPEMTVRFGWDGFLRGERFAPVFVTLSNAERPFSGVVVLRFPQDGSQWAEVVASAAATPGRSSTVTMLAAMPEQVSEIALELIDLSGSRPRVVRRVRLDRAGRAAPMPMSSASGSGLVLMVGRGSGPRSSIDGVVRAAPSTSGHVLPVIQEEYSRYGVPREVQRSTGELVARRWDRVRTARVEVAELARHWAAYDGVEGVVLDAEAELTGDQVEALLAYVRAGGRLLVVAGEPGAGWQRFVPEGVSLGALTAHRPPAGLMEDLAIACGPEGERLAHERGAPSGDLSGGAEREALLDALPGLQARVPARSVRVAAALEVEGWRAFWEGEDAAGSSVAFGAWGPVGFGRVLIVGVVPSALPERVDHTFESLVWRLLLTGMLPDWMTQPVESAESWRPAVLPSGLGTGERLAISAMLNKTARVEPVTWRVALWLGVGVVVLALLVGPFDAFVLKRLRRRQLAWATAIGWSLLGAGAAWWLPELLRAGPTRVDRAVVLDVIRDDDPQGAEAWSQGVVGVFAGRQGRVDLAARERTEGRVWRGVSSLTGHNEARTLRSIGFLQERSGVVPDELPVSIWSFRTASDHGPAEAGVRADVRATGEAAWQVELQGLPAGARIASAGLRIGTAWIGLIEAAADSEPGRLTLHSAQHTQTSDRFLPDQTLFSGYGWWTSQGHRQSPAALATLAHGPARRGLSVEDRLASGAWGAVYLEIVEDESPDGPSAAASGGWTSRWTVARVLVPLAPMDRPEVSPVRPEPWGSVMDMIAKERAP